MKFWKMHGCGNDYVYLDAVGEPRIEGMIERVGWAGMVRRMSDRHKGIGSDGVIVVCGPSAAGVKGGAQVRMRMFNADGSESEMCGNGVRCVAKMAHDRLGVKSKPMRVETGRGVLAIEYEVDGAGKVVSATVDMGEPILELEQIPVDGRLVERVRVGGHRYFVDGFKGWSFVFVSMGNPHAVMVDGGGLDAIEVARRVGPGIESHSAFPRRVNLHLMNIRDRSHAEVVTWERGAGITQACGTGACAAMVAGVLTGGLDREATVRVLGGELRVRWDESSSHVFMTGEAVDVFAGEWGEE